ncbi:MAG: hypothetical protein Q9210_000712 [Variospora velana]
MFGLSHKVEKLFAATAESIPTPARESSSPKTYLKPRHFHFHSLPTTSLTHRALPFTAIQHTRMAEPSIYDEIELEDLTYHASTTLYTYPCPCGDQFEITLQDLRDGEDVAVCPSCSLMIRVIFEAGDLPAEEPPKEEGLGAVVEVAA